MRLWSGACAIMPCAAVVLTTAVLACGPGREPSAATGDTSTGADASASTTTAAADDTTTDEPFDRSQCSTELSGAMDWTVSLLSDQERGGGLDLARASSDSVYVVDDCISRWNQAGWRSWEVQDPAWSCTAMDVDPQSAPLVVGRQTIDGTSAPLVAAFDPDGALRWTMPTGIVPTKEPPDGRPPVLVDPGMATDIVVDGQGRVFVAGLRYPYATPPRSWLRRLDPTDGSIVWEQELDEGIVDSPRLVLAGDDLVLAEPRRNAAWIEDLVLVTFDVDGNERATWSSLESLGMSLYLVALAADHQGSRALVARDSSLPGAPPVLVLLDSSGTPQWVRSGLDVPWLNETIATIGLDPCGSVVIAGAGDAEDANWGNLWIAKLDLAGELRWSHFVPAPYFGRDTTVAAVRLEPDGGVLATGLQVIGADQFGDDTVVFVDSWLGRLLP